MKAGTRIVMQPNLLATLRGRELDAAGARLSAETGMAYTRRQSVAKRSPAPIASASR
jgi:hypothetical protein